MLDFQGEGGGEGKSTGQNIFACLKIRITLPGPLLSTIYSYNRVPRESSQITLEGLLLKMHAFSGRNIFPLNYNSLPP